MRPQALSMTAPYDSSGTVIFYGESTYNVRLLVEVGFVRLFDGGKFASMERAAGVHKARALFPGTRSGPLSKDPLNYRRNRTAAARGPIDSTGLEPASSPV